MSALQDFLKLTDEQKLNDVQAMLVRRPNCIPVVLFPSTKKEYDGKRAVKYCISGDVTLGFFINAVREKWSLPSENALFFFINNTLPPISSLMKTLHFQHHDEHGYLQLNYCSENCFGCIWC